MFVQSPNGKWLKYATSYHNWDWFMTAKWTCYKSLIDNVIKASVKILTFQATLLYLINLDIVMCRYGRGIKPINLQQRNVEIRSTTYSYIFIMAMSLYYLGKMTTRIILDFCYYTINWVVRITHTHTQKWIIYLLLTTFR